MAKVCHYRRPKRYWRCADIPRVLRAAADDGGGNQCLAEVLSHYGLRDAMCDLVRGYDLWRGKDEIEWKIRLIKNAISLVAGVIAVLKGARIGWVAAVLGAMYVLDSILRGILDMLVDLRVMYIAVDKVVTRMREVCDANS